MKKVVVAVLTATMIFGNNLISIQAAAPNLTTNTVSDVIPGRTSLDFNIADKNYVQFSKPFEEIPKTMEMWVKIDSGNNKRQVLIGNYVSGKNSFSLELTADNKLRYVEFVYESKVKKTEVDIKVEDTEVATGEWMHLALVRDIENNNITIYKNGEVINEKQLDASSGNKILDSAPLDEIHYLGTDSRKSYFLDGEISSISLWKTINTQAEIQESMNKELIGTEEGLLHGYNLNINDLNINNNIVRDVVGSNAINGTTVNFELPQGVVYEKEGIDFSLNDKDLEMSSVLSDIPMTFEAWVKLDVDKKGTRNIISGNYFDAYYGDIPLVNFEITEKGEPRLYWFVDKEATDYKASGVNVYNGQWTHIAITSEKSEDSENVLFKTYINGDEMHRQSLSLTPAKLNQPLKVGEDSRFAHYFKGSMADLRIWSTTRSSKEVKENFNSIVSENDEGLLGNWLLNKDESGIYVDNSSKGNNIVSYWLDDDFSKKTSDGYKTIAVIPDTQSLALWAPRSFTTLTTWLKNHSEELGIELAIHVGDIVNDREVQSQWNNVKASLEKIDGVIPFVFSSGNHDTAIEKVDGVWYGKRDISMMNKNLPYEKYSQEPTFGGAFEKGQMDNTYSYFTINNVEFMVMSLEQNPRDEVLEWANHIAEENRSKRIIVSTHEYIYHDGELTTEDTPDSLKFIGGSNPGKQLWEKFGKKHKNIVAIIAGHVGYPDIVMSEAEGENGNSVKQILCDAQFMDRDDIKNGSKNGLGMVMLLSFKEGSNDVEINWYSTVREQYFRLNNQFSSSISLLSDESSERIALADLLDRVTEFMKSKEYSQLSPFIRSLIENSFKQAEDVYKDSGTTDQQCVDAKKDLEEKMKYSELKTDKTKLEELINECNEIDLNAYKEEGKATFNEALKEAKEVYSNEIATQESINSAYNALLDAKNSLRILEDDKDTSKLEELINECDAINLDAYKEEGKVAFSEALKEAKEVYSNEIATQESINSAYNALLDAKNSLKILETDKDALKAAIDEVEKVIATSDLYVHNDEWNILIKMFNKAKEIMNKEDSLQHEVNEAAKNLKDAYKNISSKKDEETPGIDEVKPDTDEIKDSNSENSTSSNQNNNEKSYSDIVNTGDLSSVGQLSMIMIISICSIFVLRKRKLKENK